MEPSREVTAGVAPEAGDERHPLAIPGIASLHSHAPSSAAWPGSPKHAAIPRIRSGHGARRCIASRWR